MGLRSGRGERLTLDELVYGGLGKRDVVVAAAGARTFVARAHRGLRLGPARARARDAARLEATARRGARRRCASLCPRAQCRSRQVETRTQPLARSTHRALRPSRVSRADLLLVVPPPARQPKAVPRRAHGQAHPRPPQVGHGVQGLPRLDRQLHEPPGPRPSRSCIPSTRSPAHARTHAQLANTEEYQDGESVGSLGEVFIRSVAFSTPRVIRSR